MMGNQYQPSGKFSIIGMFVTLITGSATAIISGLIVYLIGRYLNFGIPFLVPGIMGIAIGMVTQSLGQKIGKSRNPFLSIAIAAFCALLAWSTIHAADYLQFRGQAYSDILREFPLLNSKEVNFFFNSWLNNVTGKKGLLGFLLLKAYSSNLEISYLFSGATTPPLINLTGIGLILYWVVDLGIIMTVAIGTNLEYAKKPYCEKCGAWRKISFPAFGDDSNIDEVTSLLSRGDILPALNLLTIKQDGNLAKLVLDYCPVCYRSDHAKLIVIKDTGPKTWEEHTVWKGNLQPDEVKSILEFEEKPGSEV